MGTRYVWQAPLVLDSSRRKAWLLWSSRWRPPALAFKRGRPKADEVQQWDRRAKLTLWIRGYQHRQKGGRYAEMIAALAREYKIATSKAKRIYDPVNAEVKWAINELKRGKDGKEK
jgi:RimJ/RimL family protein N-acetyltransferase